MYVEDADKVFASADSRRREGDHAVGRPVLGRSLRQRWKIRSATRWSIATHIKDQSPEEMKAAMDEAMAKMPTHA